MDADSFDPQDARAFRDALGRFATGVTVITCDTGTGPLGITANSFASLSLDPPLILWSPAKHSSRYPFFAAAPHFAVHVMGDDQFELAQGFARSGDAFGSVEWQTGAHGVPLISDCLARFECTLEAAHDGGDHTIIIGRVTRVSARDGDPLVFQGGRYGGFASRTA
jgi:flavin reductase (DIM6/NTAB) family NADH-FMN oxidoreductase RutF